ncbi:unnamed protein product, partial [marine sediment metagenome]
MALTAKPMPRPGPNFSLFSFQFEAYTNKSTTMAKRGHGSQQMTTAIESQMDWIAEDLGLDPVEFRLKNLRQKGDILPNRDTL